MDAANCAAFARRVHAFERQGDGEPRELRVACEAVEAALPGEQFVLVRLLAEGPGKIERAEHVPLVDWTGDRRRFRNRAAALGRSLEALLHRPEQRPADREGPVRE